METKNRKDSDKEFSIFAKDSNHGKMKKLINKSKFLGHKDQNFVLTQNYFDQNL